MLLWLSILILTSLLFYILRRNFIFEDVNTPHIYKNNQMDKVKCNFDFHLDETSSLNDGIYFKLSTPFLCQLKFFWKTNIKEFYRILDYPWEIWNDKQDELLNISTSYNSLNIKENDQDLTLISAPLGIWNDLTKIPRQFYPLVLMAKQLHGDDLITTEEVFIVIVHLTDPSMPKSSHIIAKYLKRADITYVLQPIYQEGNLEETQRGSCVVCYSSSANAVIVPCRHVCVCQKCLTMLNKCPICRGPLASYWIIN